MRIATSASCASLSSRSPSPSHSVSSSFWTQLSTTLSTLGYLGKTLTPTSTASTRYPLFSSPQAPRSTSGGPSCPGPFPSSPTSSSSSSGSDASGETSTSAGYTSSLSPSASTPPPRKPAAPTAKPGGRNSSVVPLPPLPLPTTAPASSHSAVQPTYSPSSVATPMPPTTATTPSRSRRPAAASRTPPLSPPPSPPPEPGGTTPMVCSMFSILKRCPLARLSYLRLFTPQSPRRLACLRTLAIY